MPKCTQCGEEVEHLVNRRAELHYYQFWVEEELHGKALYEEKDAVPIGQGEFRCPECESILFNNEAEAVAFLKEVSNAPT